MGVDVRMKRAVAAFLLIFGFAMAIGSLAAKNWADNSQLEGGYGVYRIGLTQWQIIGSSRLNGDNCDSFSLDNMGEAPNCEWSTSLLGSQGDWKSAGEGALGIGAIGVILIGFAAIFTLVSIAIPTFAKWPAAFSAFLAAVAFVIGALIYDSARPAWGGDMGYNAPMGLYLAAGLMAVLSSIVNWSADHVSSSSNKQYSN